MKNTSKRIGAISLFVLLIAFFLSGSVKATGEPCAQVDGTTAAQCVKGEKGGWGDLWQTKCPGGMNACAYYNYLQCGNCTTQGDVCCTTEEMANAASNIYSKSALKSGSEADCQKLGGYCNWYSVSACNQGETSIAHCSGTISNAACCKKADSTDQTGAATSTPTSSSDTGGLVPCSNCTLCHLVIGFKRIYEFFLKLLFVATMLAITVSGVFYMVSSGSKTLTEMAKKALTYSLTAFVIGMGAWILINTVMTALGYQHPYGGRWWEFTCDTTQSAGPVSSGRTITGSGNLTGKGCEGVAQNAGAMEGWSYTQDPTGRMANGSADCSSMISRSYVAAGCSNPGSTSSEMYSRAQVIDNSNSLRAGDAIVYSGHVVMCLDNGCNNVMSANSKNGIYSRNSSYDFQQSDARVIRASDYCSDC